MVKFNYDERNEQEYIDKTKSIESAIDNILKSRNKALTVSKLAEITGYSRNTIKARGFNRDALNEIVRRYKSSNEPAAEITFEEKLSKAEEEIAQLQAETGYWFSKAASAHEIEQDYKQQTKRAHEALKLTKKEVDDLKAEVARLIDERNKLRDVIRELS